MSVGREDDRPFRPGVGVMLLDREGRVFVGRRADTPGDSWQMPQGGIDPGETPREAALRELEEEIGTDKAEVVAESRDWFSYDLPPEISRRVWGGRFRGQRQKWFVMRFTGEDGDIRLDTAHPEFVAWKWVDAAELPRTIVAFKRALYEAVIEEFRELLDRHG
ncbi:MAG: RNA pyrophosphohydrolase [Alphaproteobacteria bacterium]